MPKLRGMRHQRSNRGFTSCLVGTCFRSEQLESRLLLSRTGVLYFDTNDDDSGRLPIAGVAWKLEDSTGTQIASGTTSASGEFNLPDTTANTTLTVTVGNSRISVSGEPVASPQFQSTIAAGTGAVAIDAASLVPVGNAATAASVFGPFAAVDFQLQGFDSLGLLDDVDLPITIVTSTSTQTGATSGNINFSTTTTSDPLTLSQITVVGEEVGHVIQLATGADNGVGGAHEPGNLRYFRCGSANETIGFGNGVLLAWNEGAAQFLSGVALQDSVSNAEPGINGVAFEDQAGNGEDDETSVSNILWDLYDPANEDRDDPQLDPDTLLDFVIDEPNTLGSLWSSFAMAAPIAERLEP
jgi:hypothetical protein